MIFSSKQDGFSPTGYIKEKVQLTHRDNLDQRPKVVDDPLDIEGSPLRPSSLLERCWLGTGRLRCSNRRSPIAPGKAAKHER